MWLGFGFSVESFAELGPKPRHFVLAFLFNVNNVTILHANVQSYFDLKCRERSSDGAVRHHKGTVVFTPIITFACGSSGIRVGSCVHLAGAER